jgi:4-oxalocrotonate tautomerase
MPLINVKLIEGVCTSEQKQQIVKSLAEAMVAIEGKEQRRFPRSAPSAG